jgi:NADPH2:quinone reductase
MQAIHVTRIGEPEVLQPVTIARPSPSSGEALIKLTYSSVNFNDFMERTDYFRHEGDPVREVPFILGNEGVGVVETVGSDVTQVKVGDRVGFVMHGAQSYAEYTTLPAERLIPIPEDVPDEVAASMLVTGINAQILLHEYRPVQSGTTVLVTAGTSGIGSVLVKWASRLGATVIATVSSAAKIPVVREYGAAHIIDISTQDIAEQVELITHGKGVELALDAVGGEGFASVFESLGVRGVVVPYGMVGGKYPPFNLLSLVDRSRIVAGLLFFDFVRTRGELLTRAEAVFDAYRKGWIEPQIANILPLSQAAEAHRLLETKSRVGKLLLKP